MTVPGKVFHNTLHYINCFFPIILSRRKGQFLSNGIEVPEHSFCQAFRENQ